MMKIRVRVMVRIWEGFGLWLDNLNSNFVFYFSGELGRGELGCGELGRGEMGRRRVGLRRVGLAASWAAASWAAASCRRRVGRGELSWTRKFLVS